IPRTRSPRSSARCCSGASSTGLPGASTTRRCGTRRPARTRCARTSSSTPRWVPDALVGVDVGTTGVKALALSPTGEVVAHAEEASGTLLFDVAGRRWSEEVCEALGIPGEWLPPVNESTATGGAGDQQAGAVGVGAVRPGVLSVVLGTSGVVFAPLDVYRPEP